MDTGNRVLWTVIALVLVAAGALTTAAGSGVLPRVDRDASLLPDAVQDTWRGWGWWAWAAVIAAGLILAVLGLTLIRAELRRHGGRTLPDLVIPPLSRGCTPGNTRIRSTAIHHGIERDLARHPTVRRATVHLIGDTTTPRLHAQLDVIPGFHLPALRDHVSTSIDRLATTTGLRPDAVDVILRLTTDTPARVH
jgi:hypothetical protein